MTIVDAPEEFHRGNQITFRMKMTPDQYTMVMEWAASVPTLYFLDICAADVTKMSDVALETDPGKKKLADVLRSMDRPQHGVSYLCALMEKVSDSRGVLSDTELEGQILGDLSALRKFFEKASVHESDDFAIDYLKSLRRVAPEVAQPAYLAFLRIANEKFRLKDTVSPPLRLKKAEQLMREADALSIGRQHPVLLLTLACLYGNISAKRLMKLKASPDEFNAENALADIMLIERFSALKLQIEDIGRQGGRYMKSSFITDDKGLGVVFKCFEAHVVKYEPGQDGLSMQLDVRVKLRDLLTEIPFNEVSGEGVQEKTMEAKEKVVVSEYDKLLELLNQTPDQAR